MQLELMKVQHKKILVQLELDQLKEQETYLKTQSTGTTVQFTTGVVEDDMPAPKKTATKKAAKPVETLTESDGEDDLDSAFGSKSDVEPSVGAPEIRALLVKIVKSKGEAGKKKAKSILTKYTKDQSGLVDHILAGKHSVIYEALQKV